MLSSHFKIYTLRDYHVHISVTAESIHRTDWRRSTRKLTRVKSISLLFCPFLNPILSTRRATRVQIPLGDGYLITFLIKLDTKIWKKRMQALQYNCAKHRH